MIRGAILTENKMTQNNMTRSLAALLAAAAIGLPAAVGCSSAEAPKTPQQVEKARLQHLETSHRELESGGH